MLNAHNVLSLYTLQHSISDNKLLLLVLFLVLPILVVLITWVAVDPLHWQETSIVVS